MKISRGFIFTIGPSGGLLKAAEGRKVKFYQSPMHPWITSDKPGDCTICGGMKLVPVV